jgi:hypothetical protein
VARYDLNRFPGVVGRGSSKLPEPRVSARLNYFELIGFARIMSRFGGSDT